MSDSSESQVPGGAHERLARKVSSNKDWWPNQLNLKILHQNSSLSNPMGEGFNYAEEFKKLDLASREEGPFRAHDRITGLVAG